MKNVASPAQGTLGPLGPIQIIPPGLLGLLQLKQLGRLPDKLADTIAGVIELKDWYLTARRVGEEALFGGVPTLALATGNTGSRQFALAGVNTQVPQNQIWYVEQLTVQINPTGAVVATDLLRCCAFLNFPGAGQGHQLGADVSDYQLVARARSLICRSDRGFWAFPGDLFQLFVDDVVTTNGYTANLGLRATPCPI